jgi:hypothetical protein
MEAINDAYFKVLFKYKCGAFEKVCQGSLFTGEKSKPRPFGNYSIAAAGRFFNNTA